MPEHLKALVVIMVLAPVVFVLANRPVTAVAMAPEDFSRRRNLWLLITAIAFLAHNFWIYIIAAGLLLLATTAREPNKLALYYFLLFAVPALPARVTGLGVINYFFTIDYLRLLSLTVLLPAFLALRSQPDVDRFGRLLTDKLLTGYLVLQFLLMLAASTFTDTLRHGAFYAFLDAFLPYYVASRSVRRTAEFRDVIAAFVVASLILAPIGAFEYLKHWLLYTSLESALGSEAWGYGVYLEREGLRALASVGQPIVLGYVMAVGLGFFLYLRSPTANPAVWVLGLIGLIVGLVAPLSRGPWVGAGAILVMFIATGPSPGKGFARLGLLAAIAIPTLLLSPAGEGIIDRYFVGTGDAHENLLYRQRLLEVSLGVIAENPFFGAYDFLYSPQMQQMKQGAGIIDLVNTYLGIGLSSGLAGLSLFAGFFVSAGLGVFRSMRGLPDRNEDVYLLGRVLLSTLIGILTIIFTVSSIIVIPAINWSVAGLCVAYARMLDRMKTAAGKPAVMPAATARAGNRADSVSAAANIQSATRYDVSRGGTAQGRMRWT
jgi:O-antigen ligase